MMARRILSILLFMFLCLCQIAYSQVDVTWTNFGNTTASGNILTKTYGVDGFNAGAVSTSVLSQGTDGWVEFDRSTTGDYILGLADTDPDKSYYSINYAMFGLSQTNILIYELGSAVAQFDVPFQSTDRMKIERVGTTIHYKVNDITYYTSTVPSTTNLFVDVSIAFLNASVTGTKVMFNGSSSNSIWTVNGSSIFYNAGNVGIKNSSPAFDFDVNGSINATSILVNGQPIPTGSSSQWTTAGSDIYFDTGTVGIGTSLPSNPNNYKLAVNGKIGAKEVKVENTSTVWPDYVFEPKYNLTPLEKVDWYIKHNQHLPDVPSAAEIAADGHSLGEMDVILLKKIEELTLYVIELKKEIEKLKQK